MQSSEQPRHDVRILRSISAVVDLAVCAFAVLLIRAIQVMTGILHDGIGDFFRWLTIPVFIAAWLANTGYVQGLSGQSVGKYISGLVLVRADGGPEQPGQVWGRSAIDLFLFLMGGVLYAADCIYALVSPRRQRLLDQVTQFEVRGA